MRRVALFLCIALATLVSEMSGTLAHEGPPFPIVSNLAAGPYVVSVWTDPDTTDDGTPGGQFWVIANPIERGVALPDQTRATVSIAPLDREGDAQSGRTEPVDGQVGRQFVALLMDHEGRFKVDVAIDGPLGSASVGAEVEATYDARPAFGLLFLYMAPFVVIGGLWVKMLLRRRNREP